MATLSITIPNPVVDRVQDALAARHHYNPETDGTKAAFAKQLVIEYLKREVKEYEADTAGSDARQAAITAVEAEILLT